ncbi:GNAT family N-acetyltransferase [Streptomyces sp. NPDC048659]|uniref:GNAT family N-acetyltransferase n=1 Tax=Streptomyces sp. NPDC048659 TaxID=3155489 RepID=UPI00344998AA
MAERSSPWHVASAPDPGACADTLAAAFSHEPAVSWICGGSRNVRAAWFETTIRTHATVPGASRHTLTAPDGRTVAAAVLTPPRARPTTQALVSWSARTLLRCGPPALGRTLRYFRHTESAAPPDAWTLEFLGVRPDAAGRGAGGFLLRHLLATTPAPYGFFLTTADPANVPFYRRFGFADLGCTALGPLRINAMARPGTR